MQSRNLPARIVATRRSVPTRSGFTLVEVLLALAIISIASSILISFFYASVNLSDLSRTRKVAAEFAQAKLDLLTRHPDAFQWPALNKAGQVAAIAGPNGEPLGAIAPPSTMPAIERAAKREDAFYSRFTWEAFAALPEPDAAYIQVTVLVRWDPSAPRKCITLTSAVPRTAVKEVS